MLGIGLPQIEDFNTTKLFACTIFGAIGFGVFICGKNNQSFRPMVIGIALMAYPYFVENALATYLIGFALIAALYFWRE